MEDDGLLVVLCTFATTEYAGSAELLRHTALRRGEVDRVVVYYEDDVAPWFAAAAAAHGDDLLATPHDRARGYGYYSWKPWLIRKTLLAASETAAAGGREAVVVWCDAGVMVRRSLRPLACAARNARLITLGDEHRNEAWIKEDAFQLMGRATPRHRAAVQLNAAVQVYRDTPDSLRFLEDLEWWCGQKKVVDDSQVLASFNAVFKAHRHDQSVLSLLAVDHPAVEEQADDGVTQFGVLDPDLDPDGALLDHHRRRYRPARVAVITATVGGPHLAACVASVQAQDLPNVVHYVVVDGAQHASRVAEVVARFEGRAQTHLIVLPHNVGRGGWCGHRVYGALPWLVDAQFVAFLDEDNLVEADHYSSMLRAVVDAGVKWGHSLRGIIAQDGSDVCPDDCESLGALCHTALDPRDRLVDTNCYLLDRELAVAHGQAFNVRGRDPSGRPEADRVLAAALLPLPHVCTRRHSLKYRAGSTATSVGDFFFLAGNRQMGYDFARLRDLYVFHFDPATTGAFLRTRASRDRSYALDEWQMTTLRGLDGSAAAADEEGERFNLLNGFACAASAPLPRGSRVLVMMCLPDAVPWKLLRDRPDLRRVAYTAESPNIRHAAQWSPSLLDRHFDAVLTYWSPLLSGGRLSSALPVFCAHNTHHLDLRDPADRAQLRVNSGVGKSCAMVLERRELRGEYTVPDMGDVRLRCLDPVREALVRDLSDVTVYGQGWGAAAARNPGVKVGHALHRSQDPRHAVDILAGYTFAVIAENTDAEGYASEKLYDALLAGAIPLYYGSVPACLGDVLPEGAETGLYLDLRGVVGVYTGADGETEGWSRRVQGFLDGLSAEAVERWRGRIVSGREAVLQRVGVEAFAGCVRRAFDGIKKTV